MGFLSNLFGGGGSTRSYGPMGEMLANSINAGGRYDGSSGSKRKAEAEFNYEKSIVGCTNPRTESLYWETLEAENLPIRLAVIYAFVVGEYIKNPAFSPMGANSPEARMNATVVESVFPSYASFVKRKHTSNEALMILALSSNFMQDFIR